MTMLLSSKLILITMASMVQGQEVALPYDQDKQLSRFRSYVSTDIKHRQASQLIQCDYSCLFKGAKMYW